MDQGISWRRRYSGVCSLGMCADHLAVPARVGVLVEGQDASGTVKHCRRDAMSYVKLADLGWLIHVAKEHFVIIKLR